MSNATDIRIRDVRPSFEEHRYRTPIKFGGVASDRVTLANVKIDVETGEGKTATGFGSMPLGNVWSYPSRNLSYDQTLNAMKRLVERLAEVYQTYDEPGHAIDITHALEPGFVALADEVTREHRLADPIPLLAVLVCASPFDAALHDAFGKAHQLNCYQTYGPEFLPHELGHYLGSEYAGDRLDRYVLTEPKPEMPLYHLVGALDPLTDADVSKRIDDGLPETLGEWITTDGLTHLKIKLNGDDLDWDVDRVVGVEAVAVETQAKRGISEWNYSLDFNERCQNVEYLLEFLRRVKERIPIGYERIQYIEQPTARDLKSNPDNKMHQVAKLRPVVIDESLLDLESLELAVEMGYTGAALKACKGQTQSLLLAAAARKKGLFLCVQDLTCPGASLIHSAGLAAHVPGVAAIEANSRQFCPGANVEWEKRFPGVFTIRDGMMKTGQLNRAGLSAV